MSASEYPAQRAVFLQQLVDAFNEEELRSLCFELSVDFDSLPAIGKAGKARELVALLERSGHLPDLIALCSAQRPGMTWSFTPVTLSSGRRTDPALASREIIPRSWLLIGGGLVIVVLAGILWLRFGRGYSFPISRPAPTPTSMATATPTSTPPLSPTTPPTTSPTTTLSAPLVTMSVTVGESDPCVAEATTRSLLDIGINNNSDRDIMLTSVKLVPEWIQGGVIAGELTSTKTYTVTADAWYQMWYDALDTAKAKALYNLGKLKMLEDGMLWVRPDPIDVKEIPANKYTIKRRSQERFQIQVGISEATHYVRGALYVEIKDDAGDVLRQGPLDVYICTPGEFPFKQ
jgi:hypothetical protein